MNDTDTPQLAVPPTDTFPWPAPAGVPVTEAFVRTWTESVFHPTSFFRRMPREDDYGAVIVYYLIIGVIAAGIRLFWQSVFDFAGLQQALMNALGVHEKVVQPNGLVQFLFSPLVLLAILYIGAGITHLFLLMLRGAKYGFDVTTRVIAFSYSPVLFTVVPFIGGLVGLVWIVVLTTIGLREAHETTTAKSLSAILLPYVVLFAAIMLLALIVVIIGVAIARI